MSKDLFPYDTLTAPARRCFAITPHNTQALGDLPKAIYVGTGGDLVLRAVEDESDVTLRNVPAGSLLAIRATYIRDSGSTARDLVGLL